MIYLDSCILIYQLEGSVEFSTPVVEAIRAAPQRDQQSGRDPDPAVTTSGPVVTVQKPSIPALWIDTSVLLVERLEGAAW
jgi:hypothetical protein